ncbi:DUF6461 domain-containing protein [Streptomyces sp. CMB-StM0423]|uniref:DUF6461 domain-containing protein n=1 Tax=Streptomyces sp. CMB-StM0423 TaxID=2059884 RepID=UPI001F1D6109|nr:DUF6461 domain-containing protein [Streptomyces sp. CMB-StM0423]
MEGRDVVNGIRWIASAHDLGYTFTLCENITPEELLVRVGAEPQHIHEMTEDAAMEFLSREEDDPLGDLDFPDLDDEAHLSRLGEAGFLSRPEAIIRAGAVPGWAYAIEEFSARSTAHLAALSRGTQTYSVYRSVNGEHQIGYARDGKVLAYVDQLMLRSGEVGADEGIPDFTYTDEELLDTAFLRFLEGKHGIAIAWEDTWGPTAHRRLRADLRERAGRVRIMKLANWDRDFKIVPARCSISTKRWER